MALTPFNDNLQINAPKSLDAKYTKFSGGLGVPFTDVTEAQAAHPFYRSRGLTQLILDGGVATEYWYRDGIADGDLIPKRFSIITDNTSSLLLTGTGSVTDPLSGDVQLSLLSNNAIKLFNDGLYVGQTIKQGVVYGGIVTWLQDYNYNISAAGYYINGVFYTSPALDVTLSAPDGTFNRIDTFVVDDTGTASVLEGTPSADPAQASLDPATQLQLSFALVETGTTEPSTGVECVYIDNTEWTTAASAGTIDPNSTSSPCNGTKSIEGTGVLNGTNVNFTRSSGFNPLTSYTILKFSIRSKGAFGGNGGPNKRKLILQFKNGVTNVGSSVTILNGSYGFVDTNTTDCQNIAIPLSDFGLPSVTLIDKLYITAGGLGIIPGFRIDDICFQGVPVPRPAETLTLTTTGTSGAATLIGDVLNIPIYTAPVYTSDNGITKTTNNFQLGGSLLQNTDINVNDKTFNIFNSNTNNGLNISGVGENTTIQITTGDGNFSIGAGNTASNIYFDKTGIYTSVYGSANASTMEIVPDEIRMKIVPSSISWGFRLLSTNQISLGGYGIGTFTGIPAYQLQVDASGNIIEGTVSSGGITTADNGLTANTSSNVQLGGTLLQNTTIAGGAFGLILTGTSPTVSSLNISNNSITSGSIVNISTTSTAATGNTQKGLNISLSGANPTAFQSTYGIYSSNTHTGTSPLNYAGYFISTKVGVYTQGSTYGLWAVANGSGVGAIGVSGTASDTGGYGVYAENTTSSANQSRALGAYSAGGLAADLQSRQTSTNSVNSIVRIISTSSGGAGANGIGGSIDFYNATTSSGSSISLSTRLISKFTDSTVGTEVSQFIITGVNSGITADLFTLSGSGATKLNKYGIGTFTGTPVYTLQVDSSGNIIEGSAAGGTDTNFATDNLTATGNRSHVFNSNTLGISFNSITGSGLTVSSTSTAATGNTQKLLSISLSGSNTNNNQSTYGVYSTNSHTGTGAINYGGYFEGLGSNSYGVRGVGGSTGVYGTGTTTGVEGYGGSVGVSGRPSATNGIGGLFTSSVDGGTGVVIDLIAGFFNLKGITAAVESTDATTATAASLSASQASTFNYALVTESLYSTTNQVKTAIQFNFGSYGGTPANGLGQSVDFLLQTATGFDYLRSNQIISKWTDATRATITSQFIITGVNSASTVDMLTLDGLGWMKLTGITATAASALTAADGMIIYSTTTNGTFTSIGYWARENGTWVKW